MLLEYEDVAPILQAVGMAEARSERLNFDELSVELSQSTGTLRYSVDALAAAGLLIVGPAEDDVPPHLTNAGRQYLDLKGEIATDALVFLPRHVDDLHARDALLVAGIALVDEFRAQLLDGEGVEFARALVPPAFESVVDEPLALNLFAAAVALNARLAANEPAACVAEEIVAVAMINSASSVLNARARGQREDSLTKEQAREAKAHLNGVFELFQDDDVLNLFEMEEPADAAVSGTSTINEQLGVVDQRVEAWFRPFGWAVTAGYLDASADPSDEAPDA